MSDYVAPTFTAPPKNSGKGNGLLRWGYSVGLLIDVETETEYDYNYEGELYELGNSANIIYRDKEGRTIKQ